jgi:hypothetical protein
MSKHSKIKFLRVSDGKEVTSDEAFSKDGILKSGFSISTPMTAMDAVQKDIAKDALSSTVKYQKGKLSHTVESDDPDSDDEVDDAAPTTLSDGTDVVDHRPGFRRPATHASDSVEFAEQMTRSALLQDAYDQQDARDANAWKGGADLSGGDPKSRTDSAEDAYRAYDEAAATQYLKG